MTEHGDAERLYDWPTMELRDRIAAAIKRADADPHAHYEEMADAVIAELKLEGR